MLVQLTKATIFGEPRKAGELLEVPNQTATRWVRNGIAVPAEEVYVFEENVPPVLVKAEDLNDEDEDDLEDEDLKSDSDVEVAYDEMSAKDLYKECLKKGIEAEPRQTREYYLELLAVKEG